MSLAVKKTEWQLGLPNTIDTNSASLSDVIESLVVCRAGNWQVENCRPILFSMIVTDGNTIILNKTVGADDESAVTRIHLPFVCTKTAYYKPPVVAPEFDFLAVGLEELVEMCETVTFKNGYDEELRDAKKESFGFKSAFDGMFGMGIIYELKDDDDTIIIPFTASMKTTSQVHLDSKKIEAVIIEEIIEVVRSSSNMEPFSLNILTAIVHGGIYIPDDPYDTNKNNFGEPEDSGDFELEDFGLDDFGLEGFGLDDQDDFS